MAKASAPRCPCICSRISCPCASASRSRSRSPHQRDEHSDQVQLRVVRVARASIVLESPLRGRAHTFQLALTPASPVHDPPRACSPEVVAIRLAERRRFESFGLQLLVVGGRIDLESKP